MSMYNHGVEIRLGVVATLDDPEIAARVGIWGGWDHETSTQSRWGTRRPMPGRPTTATNGARSWLRRSRMVRLGFGMGWMRTSPRGVWVEGGQIRPGRRIRTTIPTGRDSSCGGSTSWWHATAGCRWTRSRHRAVRSSGGAYTGCTSARIFSDRSRSGCSALVDLYSYVYRVSPETVTRRRRPPGERDGAFGRLGGKAAAAATTRSLLPNDSNLYSIPRCSPRFTCRLLKRRRRAGDAPRHARSSGRATRP